MSEEWGQRQDRISILAQPKVNHQVLFCRPTIYWVDKIPKELPKVTVPVLTSRQEELSQSKKVNADFRGDRGAFPLRDWIAVLAFDDLVYVGPDLDPEEEQPTAMWPVSRAALKAQASSRVKELAQPRPLIDAWGLSRPHFPLVSKGALSATPSQRVTALAMPRSLLPSPSRKPTKKTPRGPIANITKFEELSKPRTYTYETHNPYKVSKAALQYVASPRILDISRPVTLRARVARLA